MNLENIRDLVIPVAPAPVAADNDMIVEGEAEVELEGEIETEGEEGPTRKKARTARKLTSFIFVDRIPNHPKNHAFCKLGCLSSNQTSRWEFAALNTNVVLRHVSAKHPEFLNKFNGAKETEESINALKNEVEKANDAALKRCYELVKYEISKTKALKAVP
jgi:hypothetical protein